MSVIFNPYPNDVSGLTIPKVARLAGLTGRDAGLLASATTYRSCPRLSDLRPEMSTAQPADGGLMSRPGARTHAAPKICPISTEKQR